MILPQFIPPDAPSVRSALILTGVHVSLAGTWHLTWAAAGGTLARSLTGNVARLFDASTGVALLALAIKMIR